MDDASNAFVDAVQGMFAAGMRHQAEGRFADAEACYRRVVAAVPGWADAWNNLGGALWAQGKSAAAVECYRQAIAVDHGHALAHYNLGVALQGTGDLAAAEALHRRAIQLKPDCAEAHVCLGNIDLGKGKPDQAGEHYRQALRIAPGCAQAHNNLGNVLRAQATVDQTLLDQAEASCRRAIQMQPACAEFHNNLGLVLEDQGKAEQAIGAFKEAIGLRPDFAEAWFNLSQAKRFSPDDPDLAALRKLSQSVGSLPADKAVYVHFALGKALDDAGDPPQAFDHLVRGNQLKRRSIAYDEAELRGQHQRIIRVFNAEFFKRRAGSGNPSQTPVFVLGMPRSGSTLVEQILSSHRQIHGAGELMLLSRIARGAGEAGGQSGNYPQNISAMPAGELAQLAEAYLRGLPPLPPGKLRITDKMPGNFVYAGLIHLMLPNARIIHTVRDPMDTCASCFSKLFADGAQYSYDLGELGRYYRMYAELMDHWRSVLPLGVMLDLSYEALVDDLDGQARRLIRHCGLEWDSACLDFHQNRRAVSTPSKTDVRQPIHRRSIGRWRRHQAQLGVLLAELGIPSSICPPQSADSASATPSTSPPRR